MEWMVTALLRWLHTNFSDGDFSSLAAVVCRATHSGMPPTVFPFATIADSSKLLPHSAVTELGAWHDVCATVLEPARSVAVLIWMPTIGLPHLVTGVTTVIRACYEPAPALSRRLVQGRAKLGGETCYSCDTWERVTVRNTWVMPCLRCGCSSLCAFCREDHRCGTCETLVRFPDGEWRYQTLPILEPLSNLPYIAQRSRAVTHLPAPPSGSWRKVTAAHEVAASPSPRVLKFNWLGEVRAGDPLSAVLAGRVTRYGWQPAEQHRARRPHHSLGGSPPSSLSSRRRRRRFTDAITSAVDNAATSLFDDDIGWLVRATADGAPAGAGDANSPAEAPGQGAGALVV